MSLSKAIFFNSTHYINFKFAYAKCKTIIKLYKFMKKKMVPYFFFLILVFCGTCKMLIFLGVHLTYTFPAIGLLSLIARPLLCRSDVLKMSLVSAATLTYIYLWGCYANFNGLLKYPQKNALASIGHVSLAAQTILTLLWSSFCFRWSTSCLNFNFDKPTYHLIR